MYVGSSFSSLKLLKHLFAKEVNDTELFLRKFVNSSLPIVYLAFQKADDNTSFLTKANFSFSLASHVTSYIL